MALCNILETDDATFASLMLFDREEGDAIQLASYSPGVNGLNEPALTFCHVTMFLQKCIVSKAPYLQRDVFMPDRFSTTPSRVCMWLSGVTEYTNDYICALYTPDHWYRVLYHLGVIRPRVADESVNDIHRVASTFYHQRGGKTSWIDFLSFLLSDYADSDYPALLVAAMINNYNSPRAVYYELLMLMGAIDRRRERVNPSMCVLAGLCDCIVFEAHIRWLRERVFPHTRTLACGRPKVHLAILKELPFHARK